MNGGKKGIAKLYEEAWNSKTADDAITMIRNWKLARTRALGMGLPDVGDLEMRDGLVGIVKDLEAANINLQFRIRNMMSLPDAKRPTTSFMADMERALLEELKSIAADENVLTVEQGMINAVQNSQPQATQGTQQNAGQVAQQRREDVIPANPKNTK